MFSFIKKLFFFTVFLILAGAIALGGYLYKEIVIEPGDAIKPENINAILGKESPVFYNDNLTQLGVFFSENHRQYVSYEDIPENFVNALVAAEDNRFFEHFGFDLFGIGRAMIKNIEARRIVQGGSTLTQQTAKNLFKRTERSYKEKLKELIYALKLEYHYPKEKIFEFYANQFYVSGNGHGLGVAARYYFDKEVSELTLLDCAFIAGSVKRPNYYNPFIKKSEEAADKARKYARTRTDYVLNKMFELEMIGTTAYQKGKEAEIEFNKGKVGYSLDYVMEMVKDAVTTEEVEQALAARGVDNVATSGIRIITTVDKPLQDKTLYALRHNLSNVDVMLKGYEREEVQKAYQEIAFQGDGKLEIDSFLFGEVSDIRSEKDNFFIEVDFGLKIGKGIILREGLERLAEARVKFKKNVWTKSAKKDVLSLFKQFEIGDKVWVSVKDFDEGEGVTLELEKYPEVQGAALVIKDGAIRGMAGGTENRFYNRAVYAKRTMGSSFKPFVYAAAIQLGWSSSDLLKNSRDLFEFHHQSYFPRPDHKSPYSHVSMSWAGVHSENLASVWLLSRLCDKLSPMQFEVVASYLGLTPKVVDGVQEPYNAYKTRIRDRFGIVVDRKTLRSGAYRSAVMNSEADFVFEDLLSDYRFFKDLHYGLDFEMYKEELNQQKVGAKEEWLKSEIRLRQKLLKLSYLKLETLRNDFERFKNMVEDPFSVSGAQPALSAEPSYLYRNQQNGDFIYTSEEDATPYMIRMSVLDVEDLLLELPLHERSRFWRSVRLYDKVSVAGFDLLNGFVEDEFSRLQSLKPYSLEVLSTIEDFRIYVGLRYLIALSGQSGIRSKMEPVLSFPLGSNVTSLLETTRMYETMVKGSLTTYGDSQMNSESDALLIIDRIESEDGELLYQPKRQTSKVFADNSRIETSHILENIVKFGTGRKADKQVRLTDKEFDESEINELGLAIPLLGKTGTANRYTNSSFFGYLPGVAESGDGLGIENGYAIGVYVGYDNNDPMRHKTVKITGSSGALPAWIDIVNELVDYNDYVGRLDPVDMTFSGLHLKQKDVGQLNLAVNQENGGILYDPARKVTGVNRYRPSIVSFGRVNRSGSFAPQRNFMPFWMVKNDEESTEDQRKAE